MTDTFDNWPVCTEMPEDVWHVSEWLPGELMEAECRKRLEAGQALPTESEMADIMKRLTERIIENNGLSYNGLTIEMLKEEINK